LPQQEEERATTNKYRIMDTISAPRPLVPDEAEALTALLKSHLRLHNCSCAMQAEEDATDLLNYANDMIEDGETVGKVLEELEFMELEICDVQVLENMRCSLAEFLAKLHNSEGTRKNWRDMLEEQAGNASSSAEQDSYEVRLLSSENHVSVDLSAKNAAEKKKQEMQSLFGEQLSLKDRMSMYNERGELIKRQQSDDGEDEAGNHQGQIGGKSIDEKRREELMAIMNDRSLTKNEKSEKMEEVRAKYNCMAETNHSVQRVSKIAETNTSIGGDSSGASGSHFNNNNGGLSNNTGKVDLSAKAAAAKHAKEMANLFGNGKTQGRSLKDRMAMYNERGEIIKKAQDGEEDDSNFDLSQGGEKKTNDELRREELMAIMKDKSLDKKEKSRKMNEVREKYNNAAFIAAGPAGNAPGSAHVMNDYSRENSSSSEEIVSNGEDCGDNENPLSAKAAAQKNKREMQSLFGSGRAGNAMSSNRQGYEQQLLADRVHNKLGVAEAAVPHRRRSSIESSSSTASRNDKNDAPSPSLDVQRRAELQSIMKDGTLKKEERRKKMEDVKVKYAALAKEKEQGGNGGGGYATSNGQEDEAAASRHCSIDLSAKSYADRSGKELESINVKSLSERKSMYSNQSTIVAGSRGQHQQQQAASSISLDHQPKRNLGLHSKHRTKTATTVDPTAFAFAENGLYGVQREKKKSTRHEYGGRF